LLDNARSIQLAKLLSVGDLFSERFQLMPDGFFSKRLGNRSYFFAVSKVLDFSRFFIFKAIDLFDVKESLYLP
jgi:hypothetical protein